MRFRVLCSKALLLVDVHAVLNNYYSSEAVADTALMGSRLNNDPVLIEAKRNLAEARIAQIHRQDPGEAPRLKMNSVDGFRSCCAGLASLRPIVTVLPPTRSTVCGPDSDRRRLRRGAAVH